MAKPSRSAICAAVLLAAVLLAAGPVAAQDRAEGKPRIPPKEQLGRGNDCTYARSIDDWEAVDRDHIIIKGMGREEYLVQFSGACIANPRFEHEIGVVSRDSRLCPYGGDALIIGGERCTILNIWQLPQKDE
ncbi:DUF6491 family protein [Indioceanicola profundi]|uniref:DUF6491 family protein n=1 Tax=Indioceanicola profundi TaxID=2220096 RepID=UPI0013C52803|nr:DUF6491 family protein [Indioceanicola profundi]